MFEEVADGIVAGEQRLDPQAEAGVAAAGLREEGVAGRAGLLESGGEEIVIAGHEEEAGRAAKPQHRRPTNGAAAEPIRGLEVAARHGQGRTGMPAAKRSSRREERKARTGAAAVRRTQVQTSSAKGEDAAMTIMAQDADEMRHRRRTYFFARVSARGGVALR